MSAEAIFGPVSRSGRAMVSCGWDDVPHLSEEWKAKRLAGMREREVLARTKGTPTIGAGAIYPHDWRSISCTPFQIPREWLRCYALDVGWRWTAALWLAQNPVDRMIYAFGEYKAQQKPTLVHAAAVKARGAWIPGVIDPAARGRSPHDGKRLVTTYRDKQHGLDLRLADNAVEAGIDLVNTLIETGMLVFFDSLRQTRDEMAIYRRELDERERGQIVKKDDHLMDCLRYGVMSGLAVAKTPLANPAMIGANAAPAGDTDAGY